MKIGIPEEIKADAYRVALLPVGVHLLVEDGHEVSIETPAGSGSGYTDKEYLAAGASIAESPKTIFNEAVLMVKIKEPRNLDLDAFLNQDKGMRNAFNIRLGKIKHLGVANAFPNLPDSF